MNRIRPCLATVLLLALASSAPAGGPLDGSCGDATCHDAYCELDCLPHGCEGEHGGGWLRSMFGWGGRDCCGDCCAEPCEIACLIYKAQISAYACDRKEAIDDLGDDFCCACNPEIMTAFVFALGDCDARVRAEAADEIGDQIDRCPCCCTPDIVCALKYALADCDRDVRDEAEEALEECGYECVDVCCDAGCTVGRGPLPHGIYAPDGGYAPHGVVPVPGGAAPIDLPPGAAPMGDVPAPGDAAPAPAGDTAGVPQPAAEEVPGVPAVPMPSAKSESGRGNVLARLFGRRK